MDYARLLFSFKGRTNRARFLVVQLALLTFWFTAWPKLPIFLSSFWILVVAIVMFWISTATTVKRLHDLDHSGYWAIPIAILNRISLAHYGLFLGLSFGVNISIATELLLVMVAVAMCLLATWIFIELYFLIGTDGTNRFGPDPLATLLAGTSQICTRASTVFRDFWCTAPAQRRSRGIEIEPESIDRDQYRTAAVSRPFGGCYGHQMAAVSI